MNVLALDTVTDACSVAVLHGGQVQRRHVVEPRRHTAVIFDLVDSALGDAGLAIDDVELVAFGHGPGTFTGVRVAASVAQGIALARDIPLAPVDSLCAVARHAARADWRDADKARDVVVAMDARRGEIYAAVYRFDVALTPTTLLEPVLMAPAGLTAAAPAQALCCGNAWSVHAEHFDPRLLGQARADVWAPDAGEIAELALAAGSRLDAAAGVPRYLRGAVD